MPRVAPSKVACQRCHEKRVKCDRGEGSSCTHCRIARIICKPFVSRRGRHRKLPIKDFIVPPPGHYLSSLQTRASHEESAYTFDNVQLDTAQETAQPSTESRGIERSTGQTPYMVDPSNISYLIREFGYPSRNATDTDSRPIEDYLHKAMLDKLGQPTIQHIDSLRRFKIEQLKHQGSFDLPTPKILSSLLDTYFRYTFPAMPILDKSEFMQKIESNTLSPLLLNAVLMVATIFCPDSLITEAGFVSRFVGSLTYYHRAKDIYDAGYENDAITVIQATFLLSHWWSGPLEQKDPWYWLGVTAGMAQGIGMHQIKTYSLLSDKRRALWRRLWWIIYAGDIHMSMCLDRVPHVSDSFCDIPEITDADLEELLEQNLEEGIGTPQEQVLFVKNYVQFARTVSVYHPWRISDPQVSCHKRFMERISEWSKSLPIEKAYPISTSPWAMLTQVTYDLYHLLLYRKNPEAERSMRPGSPEYEIGTRLFRIFEDLMTSYDFLFIAGHILPATMATLCIHITNVGKGDFQTKKISEHRAQFCLYIMRESQESWPIVASVYPFFTSLFKRYCSGTQSESETLQIGQWGDSMLSGSEHRLGLDDGLYERLLLEEDPAMSIPSFPFCNLFDIFLTPPSDEPSL